MIKVNNKVEQYIKQVPQMGIFFFLVGILCLGVLFKVTSHDPQINIPFAILGFFIGYFLVNKVDPGGRVDFWLFSSAEQTDDQKKLYELISTTKNKKLLLLTTILLSILFTTVTYLHSVPNEFNTNNIIWLIFWSTLTSLSLENGVKYISAWRNIRNNMK